MKKYILTSLFIFLSAILSANEWVEGYFVDDFGDSIGISCITNKERFLGSFTDTVATDSPLGVNFIFTNITDINNANLCIELYKYNGKKATSFNFTEKPNKYNERYYEIVIKSDVSKFSFHNNNFDLSGRYMSRLYGILSTSKSITVSIKEYVYQKGYIGKYIFSVDATNFSDIIEPWRKAILEEIYSNINKKFFDSESIKEYIERLKFIKDWSLKKFFEQPLKEIVELFTVLQEKIPKQFWQNILRHESQSAESDIELLEYLDWTNGIQIIEILKTDVELSNQLDKNCYKVAREIIKHYCKKSRLYDSEKILSTLKQKEKEAKKKKTW